MNRWVWRGVGVRPRARTERAVATAAPRALTATQTQKAAHCTEAACTNRSVT